LLYVMAEGSCEGKGAEDPELRAMFTREYLMASDWYRERLRTKQRRDIALWKRHVAAIERFRASGDPARDIDIDGLLAESCGQLARVSAPSYLKELTGTIGADPFCESLAGREGAS